MNLLFITERWPYPPTNGGMLRTHHLLKGISKHHQVDLICFADRNVENTEYPDLKVHTVRPRLFTRFDRLCGVFDPTPIYPLANINAEFADKLRELDAQGRVDLVHIDTLGMGYYAGLINAPCVIDVMDCISVNYRRLASIQSNWIKSISYGLEAIKTEQFERSVALKTQFMITCTMEDAKRLDEITGVSARIVENGIDAPVAFQKKGSPDHSLVFVGFLDYSANRDAVTFFASQVLPLVLREFPDSVFHVIGKGSPPVVDNAHAVRFRGYVDDLAGVYANASVVVAPLRSGSGIKNKVLEAMAYARPVAATPVAVEGIGATAGIHYLVENTPDGLAAGIIRLFKDASLLDTMGGSGQQYVRNKFSWNTATEKLLAIYEKAVQQR